MTKEDWINFSQIKTLDDIQNFSNRYNNGKLHFETLQHEISFLYNVGLFYSEHYEVKASIDIFFRKKDEYYLAVYFYLKAIKLYEDNKDVLDSDFEFVHEVIRRLYVNIGNEFSNQFRSIDALSYYRRALEIDDCFDMAIGNFALGIEHHTPLIGLEKDKYCLVFNLLEELYADVHIENLDSGHDFFIQKKLQYRQVQASYIRTIVQRQDANYNPYAYFTEIDNESNSYEDWCVRNTLYLNFVNDLGNYEEVKFDIDVQMLNSKLKLADARLYALNNLFELYLLQRKKIFECKDLSNNDELFELVQVFQCLYSYFDKVAFFIYKFFKLTGKEHIVNINRIWEMEDADKNNLLDYKNQHLYNIYWLRKEYRENKDDTIKINDLLSPDAQDYANIRNTLEHKEYSFVEVEGLTYLNPILLYKKTIKLAKVVRNMILSIIQMITVEQFLVDPKTNKRNLDLVYFSYEGFK